MKILELRFQNLNSLYGEWCIDFTHPEYATNGIFALTGPTGSGKSTILDAICLALYGETPRLGKITKSSNEIMSRKTGECFAEVVFESQAGRFRCHWSQHRARRKADGELQNPRHEIAEAGGEGRVIEHQIRRVAAVIEEKTGMDFDRFTRSILLAQGGFDTFLKADIEQKSRILEQITGTEIYSDISRRVHERKNQEKKQLEIMQAETAGIVILELEQEQAMQHELETKRKQETELAEKCNETAKAITWLSTIDNLRKEIRHLAEEAVKLRGTIDAFQPERDQLERALQAASLDGAYATLAAFRKQQSDDQAVLKEVEAVLPELKVSADTQIEKLQLAEQQTYQAKEVLKVETPLLQKIRSLDQKLAEQEKAVSEVEQTILKDAAQLEETKQTRIQEQKKRIAAEKTLGIVEEYCTLHAHDAWLIGGLAGIEEQLGSLMIKQQEIAQQEINLKKADVSLKQVIQKFDESTKQCGICEQKLGEAIKNRQQGQQALNELLSDQLLREYRTEKENLLREMIYLRKIEELEGYRSKLEDGKPCPLCGSKQHPFAEGNVPVPDEIEQKIDLLSQLIRQAENLETANKKLEIAETLARQNLNDSEKRVTQISNDKQVAEKTLTELKDSLQKRRSDFDALKQGVSDKLQPLGIAAISESQLPSLLESLQTRLKAWQEQTAQKIDIEKQIADLDSELKRLDAVIAMQSAALAEKQEHLEIRKKEYVVGLDERKKMYANKNPDAEERLLHKAIEEAEKAEKQAGNVNAELQQRLTTAKAQVDSLQTRLEQRMPELNKLETDFSSALASIGFSDENQFLAARLSAEERNALSVRAKELDNAQTEIKIQQKDRETRLEAAITQKITNQTLEELESQFKVYEDALKALRDTIAGFKHKLNENAAAKERIQEKRSAIDFQKKECLRWERLHGLIGSADGKKYRNFAQGLTFELMISHANRQLAQMSDRYLLMRDEHGPLELNVIDDYQAGEIRSTKNLSGGESFIVSLALALGLSKMASRKVRVDSLFLDEGFGTLDEDSLETALETLSGLHQDGKLIGVISHVVALKERITTQIGVRAHSGGKSVLHGPGCSKLS